MKAGVIADGLKKSGLRPSGLSESGFRLTRFRFGPFEPNKDKCRPSWHKLSSFSLYGPKKIRIQSERTRGKLKKLRMNKNIRIESGFCLVSDRMNERYSVPERLSRIKPDLDRLDRRSRVSDRVEGRNALSDRVDQKKSSFRPHRSNKSGLRPKTGFKGS